MFEPSIKNLAIALRNKSMWPAGFSWDYCETGQCAIGLSEVLWSVPFANTQDLARLFSVSQEALESILIGASDTFRRRGQRIYMWEVTPEHIASLLDELIDAPAVSRKTDISIFTAMLNPSGDGIQKHSPHKAITDDQVA